MAIFTDASGDVKILATEIIDRYHSHLIEARIGYFYRCGPWRNRKRIVHARAQKPSGLLYAVTGYDFIITINYETWSNMRQETKDALIDHELQHCCRGEDNNRLGISRVTTSRTLPPSFGGMDCGRTR